MISCGRSLRSSDAPDLSVTGRTQAEESGEDIRRLAVDVVGLTSHGDMNSVDPASNKLLTFNQR